MRLSKILSSLFVIAYAVALPTVQNADGKTTASEDLVISRDENAVYFTLPEYVDEYPVETFKISNGMSKDWLGHKNNCKNDLYQIICYRKKEEWGMVKRPTYICDNIYCKNCFENNRNCYECSSYVKDTLKYNNCDQVKIDLRGRSDHHF